MTFDSYMETEVEREEERDWTELKMVDSHTYLPLSPGTNSFLSSKETLCQKQLNQFRLFYVNHLLQAVSSARSLPIR